MRINFICTVGNSGHIDVGIGHFKRSQILAKELSCDENEINFIIYGEQSPILKIDKEINITNVHSRDFNHFLDKKDIDKLRIPDSDISFIDISNPYFVDRVSNLTLLIDKIKNKSDSVVIFDGLGDESIINKAHSKILYDYLVVPYFGAEEEFNDDNNHFLGVDYFIFEQNESKFKKFEIDKNAKNICITCGGTDSNKISLKILKAIASIKNIAKVKVIIGPNFSENYIHEITNFIDQNSLIVKKIISPKSIQKYICWSDITIATSGLTKYELIKEGVPSIIIPFDQKQFLLNKSSQNKNAFLTLSPDRICLELESVLVSLMEDYSKRKKISQAALDLIDGKGVSRIISRINKK